jgi:hypothetical protein
MYKLTLMRAAGLNSHAGRALSVRGTIALITHQKLMVLESWARSESRGGPQKPYTGLVTPANAGANKLCLLANRPSCVPCGAFPLSNRGVLWTKAGMHNRCAAVLSAPISTKTSEGCSATPKIQEEGRTLQSGGST